MTSLEMITEFNTFNYQFKTGEGNFQKLKVMFKNTYIFKLSHLKQVLSILDLLTVKYFYSLLNYKVKKIIQF